ncbi:MAG TPA: DUF4097 family beta strand repeat-containing protein [Thermoanaerobaculia bacterium]|nr:DUF4097 family beta strand repeat-containing protein [Thermoanaerobaculia bacterium]
MTRKGLQLTAALFLLTSCVVSEKNIATIHRDWPGTEVRKINLREVNGNVTVTPSNDGRVALEATVRYAGVEPTTGENRGLFETKVAGDTLRIGSVPTRKVAIFIRNREVAIDYRLKVPPDTTLDIETVNGKIGVAGVTASTSLDSINGSVSVETAGTSALDARTVNGSVKARFLKDFIGAKVRTVNGPVHIILPADSSFVCDLTQVNGGFESNFPLSIRSSRGNREITSVVNGGKYLLKIKTVNGEVDLTREGSPSAVEPPEAPPTIESEPPLPPPPPVAPRPDTE